MGHWHLVMWALGSSIVLPEPFIPILHMFFPTALLNQAVELTLLFVAFLQDDQNRLDLDRCEQVEAIQTVFYTVLLQCGDAIFLQSAKLYWRATASSLAMLEGQHCANIDTPTQIDRPDRPLQCLESCWYNWPGEDSSPMTIHSLCWKPCEGVLIWSLAETSSLHVCLEPTIE